jgi:sec-independent protein translocase protein TatA
MMRRRKTPLETEGHPIMGELLTPTHLILVLVVALLIFGPRKLPELGKGLGEGLKGFKDGIKGMGQPEPTTKQDAAVTAPKNEPIQPS